MSITDVLGFAILAIAIYMVVTRVLPYFRSPRLSRKDREELIRDAELLLESSSLTDDERHQIREARNTLELDSKRDREAWGGELPVADAAATIRALRDEQADRLHT